MGVYLASQIVCPMYSEGYLGREAMLSNIMKCLGNDGVIMRIDGWASVIGFRKTVGNTMVKADDNDGIDDVVRQVRTPIRT